MTQFFHIWQPRWRHRPRISLCLGSCQLSRGFEEFGNQSNKQISATFRKIIFHFQAKVKLKVKSTRHLVDFTFA